MKRVRNFVTLCGGRYPFGLKLNEAQAAPRLVSVRFFLCSIPVSIIREFPSREWPRMVLVPTDDRAWHQRFSFRSRREKKGKLLRTGRDEVLPNHTNHMISHKTEERLELVGSGRVRLETSQWEPTRATPSTSTADPPQICSLAQKGLFFSLDNLIFLIKCYSPIFYEPLSIKIVAP